MQKPTVKSEPSSPAGGVAALAVTALGIVFGDIGTSPLYSLKTVIELAGGKPSPESALGLLSLVIWTLLIVTSIKYVTFVMRADNHGEGGILALMSLLNVKQRYRPGIVAVGLFGAATASPHRTRHRRDHNRKSVDHHGCILHDQAGHTAWLVSPLADQSDLFQRLRPDLHRFGELASHVCDG
jgi:hypothetical protein